MDALIVWLMLINLMSQAAFSVLTPFYPGIAKNERNIDSTWIGLVMSSSSVTFVITSYFVGMLIGKIGRRVTMYSGIVIQAVGMIGFGCIIWINDRTMFLIASFVLRFIGGIASGWICVAAYAMASIKYPDSVQAKISLLEAANGAGLFIGPIFGGLIYQFTSFCVPFFLFTGISLIFLPFMRKYFTEDLDRNDAQQEGVTKLSYFKLLRHKRVVFAGMSQFFNILMFTIGQPIFGPRLSDDYGFSNAIVGVCFALPTLFYILVGLLFLPFVSRKLVPRATIMVGFLIIAASTFLMGPSSILGLPKQSPAMMIGGLALLGAGAAWTVIPIIPEMLDSVKGQYLDQQSDLSDGFSGIFNVAGGFGQIVGPALSGALDKQVGFNYTLDFFGCALIGFNLIYILSCGGWELIKAWRNKKRTIEVGSPKHHLLADEESDSQNENDGSDEESTEKTQTKINKSQNSSINVSTDVSIQNDSSYGIN